MMAGKQTLRHGPRILVHKEHSGFKTNALALVTIFRLVLLFCKYAVDREKRVDGGDLKT